jgi:hypothetical protein
MGMKTLTQFGVVLGLCCSLSIYAADENKTVYYWVDAQGNSHFTDHPVSGKEMHEMQVQIANPPATAGAPSSGSTAMTPSSPDPSQSSDDSANSTYALSILSPMNGAIIRDNAGNLSAQIQITPAIPLTTNMPQLSLDVDGKLFPCTLTSTSCQASNLDRGEHQLKAILTNKDGKQFASSDSIKVNLFRVSSLLRPAAGK